jgi:hypothetical protein
MQSRPCDRNCAMFVPSSSTNWVRFRAAAGEITASCREARRLKSVDMGGEYSGAFSEMGEEVKERWNVKRVEIIVVFNMLFCEEAVCF